MAESSNSEKVIPVTVSRPMGHAINENQRSWKQIAEMYIREDKSFADVADDDDEQNQRFFKFTAVHIKCDGTGAVSHTEDALSFSNAF